MAKFNIDARSKEVLDLIHEGYISNFIDKEKSISDHLLNSSDQQHLPKINNGKKGGLHYTNLSVYLNTKRRLPFYSAYNINGATKTKVVRDLDFIKDPRILDEYQTLDALYDLRKGKGKENQDFDKGHLAANNEMAWAPDAQTKAYQTFFFTNAAPQTSILNKGIWKTLESYFIEESKDAVNKKICVFSGPVLKPSDPEYLEDKSYKLPVHFFKVVVFKYKGEFYSTAFVMSQKLALLELKLIKADVKVTDKITEEVTRPFEDFDYKDVFQFNVDIISRETGIEFKWPGVKQVSIPGSKKRLKRIDEIKNSKDAAKRQKEADGIIKESFIDTSIGFIFPDSSFP